MGDQANFIRHRLELQLSWSGVLLHFTTCTPWTICWLYWLERLEAEWLLDNAPSTSLTTCVRSYSLSIKWPSRSLIVFRTSLLSGRIQLNWYYRDHPFQTLSPNRTESRLALFVNDLSIFTSKQNVFIIHICSRAGLVSPAAKPSIPRTFGKVNY